VALFASTCHAARKKSDDFSLRRRAVPVERKAFPSTRRASVARLGRAPRTRARAIAPSSRYNFTARNGKEPEAPNMTGILNREIQLAARPKGWPKPSDFTLTETRVSDPADGEVLVRNLYMSVDPYMRGRMEERDSYIPAFRIGEVLAGGAVGRVLASRHPGFSEGDYVSSMCGWREHFVLNGAWLRKLDPDLAPISHHLGALGMPGLTAWVGLLDIGAPKAGETVFVSAAAGAVGSLVGQIARIRGCRAVGSAGSEAKVKWLCEELRFDAAFDYKRVDVGEALAAACPDGIDVYFDNVGGAQLEAAIERMNPFGRIPVCGMISQYNASKPAAAPRNLPLVVAKRIRLQGFIVADHFGRLDAFVAEMGGWIREGRVVVKETVVQGIERAVDAFLGMLRGENVGKMIVKLAD
jgi:NADPH-dependent curcumin reductase CurA